MQRLKRVFKTEADIHFNSGFNWDVNDDPHNSQLLDFRRIAIHEIGHTLGLGHFLLTSTIMFRSANSLSAGPDDLCGIAILYGTPQDCTMLLASPVTISGNTTTAIFTGGVSSDKLATFDTSFISTDSLDVVSTIVVEDAHIGLHGNLYVVVVLADGALLAKNSDGGFDPITEDITSFPSVESKVLAGANELLILENLVAANLGITNIDLSFYIAYSLVTEPGELYFASTPIRLTITE
jgi:hypothetical protein